MRSLQEAADKPLVPHAQQGNRKLGGDRLRQRGLTAARWAYKQQSMTWFDSVAAQQIATVVLFDELADGLAHLSRKHQVGHPSFRLLLVEQAVGCLVATHRGDVRAAARPAAS